MTCLVLQPFQGGWNGRAGETSWLVPQAGTTSSFSGPAEIIGRRGLSWALHTGRATPYLHTRAAGGEAAKTQPTQVGRAAK